MLPADAPAGPAPAAATSANGGPGGNGAAAAHGRTGSQSDRCAATDRGTAPHGPAGFGGVWARVHPPPLPPCPFPHGPCPSTHTLPTPTPNPHPHAAYSAPDPPPPAPSTPHSAARARRRRARRRPVAAAAVAAARAPPAASPPCPNSWSSTCRSWAGIGPSTGVCRGGGKRRSGVGGRGAVVGMAGRLQTLAEPLLQLQLRFQCPMGHGRYPCKPCVDTSPNQTEQ